MTSAKIEVSHEASGLIHFVQPIGVNKAKERFFTARPTAAHEAWNNGFVNHETPVEKLEAFTSGSATRIAANAMLAVRAVKAQSACSRPAPGSRRRDRRAYPSHPAQGLRQRGLRRGHPPL